MREEMISTEGLGKKVEVSSIPLELKKLWEQDEASTNASLMNLLVYTEDPTKLSQNSSVIQDLTRDNACRAVLIAMDRNSDDVSIDSWITAHCHLTNGRKSVCSEQVSFLLKGKSLGRLRNTVFSNLNSDLPLVFWWQGELSDLFEERLYRLLNRLIIDSTSWQDPRKGYQLLNHARVESRGRLTIQDLAWTRSYHFRLALAGLCDDPIAQNNLNKIEQLQIIAQSNQKNSALLLMAWVAARLGWKLKDSDGNVFDFETKSGSSVHGVLEFDDQGAPISQLRLQAPDCQLDISRKRDSKYLSHSLQSTEHQIKVRGPADSDNNQGLVASQLSRGGKNSLFLHILPVFEKILDSQYSA